MSETRRTLIAKTMAFGGVPAGNMKANELEKVTCWRRKREKGPSYISISTHNKLISNTHWKDIGERIDAMGFCNFGNHRDENWGRCNVAGKLLITFTFICRIAPHRPVSIVTRAHATAPKTHSGSCCKPVSCNPILLKVYEFSQMHIIIIMCVRRAETSHSHSLSNRLHSISLNFTMLRGHCSRRRMPWHIRHPTGTMWTKRIYHASISTSLSSESARPASNLPLLQVTLDFPQAKWTTATRRTLL